MRKIKDLISRIFIVLVVLSAGTINGQNEILKRENQTAIKRFNIEKDLLLAQFDCKTDVDDLHTVAAFASLMSDKQFDKVRYHAVAGTYGIQEGLYVPANDLFELAFGDQWSDAHADFQGAVKSVSSKVLETLQNNGDVWIAEAGQSDFTAAVIEEISAQLKAKTVKERMHVVQHSTWNEEVTDPKALKFVKEKADYHKIPDGNAVGNGTPGFRSPEFSHWESLISDQKLKRLWQRAVKLGNKYNGKEGRYNNMAVTPGGLDFSDLSETCWILGIGDIVDTAGFFNRFMQ